MKNDPFPDVTIQEETKIMHNQVWVGDE